MKITAVSDAGKRKKINEDTVILINQEYPLIGVADGMGGHVGGAVASSKASESVVASLQYNKPNPQDMLQAFQNANRYLIDLQEKDTALKGMGTTLTIMWYDNNKAVLGHVGDSRAYRFRKNELSMLTNDHSVVYEMLQKGILTQQEAKEHPYRHMITRAVGTDALLNVDLSIIDTQAGDIFLICSDGLTEYIDDYRISEFLRNYTIQDAANLMMEEVLMRGGLDNVSIVIAEVEHE